MPTELQDDALLAAGEPFAWGYLHAARPDPESRIAAGLLAYARHVPLSIDPAEVFAAPARVMGTLAMQLDTAEGVRLRPDVLEARVAAHPEAEAALRAAFAELRRDETLRLVDEARPPHRRALAAARACWGAGGGHSNPDYALLLRVGTVGLRAKIRTFRAIHADKVAFYDALETALDALETLADRLRALAESTLGAAAPADRPALARLAAALARVPREPPRDFFEACESFWLAFSFLECDSPGLFDLALGPFYERADPADRRACLAALWELFHKTRTWNLCVGGSDEFGRDRTCALTLDVLRLASEKRYETPNLTLRTHPATPDAVWRAAVDSIATGIGMPALYNDACVCPALESLGIPASDAHLYCLNGCNQIDVFGKSHMGLEDGEVCVAKALELALFDGFDPMSGKRLGPRTGDAAAFATFDALYAAFLRQLDALADEAAADANAAQAIFAARAPNPYKSLLVEGCVEKGLDYKNRGPIYGHGQILTEGLPDAADALAAARRVVFEERRATMAELLEALRRDFEGFDALRRALLDAPKFGNDDPAADDLYAAVTDHLYRRLRSIRTFRGGVYGGGCSTFNRAADYGRSVGALPNGRRRGEPLLADSVGASPGCDRAGPTALLNSCLRADQRLAASGHVLQMKFRKEQFETPAGREAFLALAKTYFARGGQQLQVNVVSRAELLDAQERPERHRNLVVRVGGFSCRFVRLPRDLQDHVIARTEIDLP